MWKWETDGQPKAVVVIIHSAFEYHHWYAWLIEKLRTAGYHVVMGDLPGHSEGSKYTRVHDETIEDYLRYIKTLMENALTYHLPVFIIGHGLGGTLAIRFLKKSKLECAGLILSSPWLQLKKQPNLLKSALTNVGGPIISNKKITLDFDKQMLTRNIDGYQEMDDVVSYQTNVTVRWYRDIQQLMKKLTTQEERTLTLPILLLTAKQDKISEYQMSRTWLLNQSCSEFQYKEWTFSYHNLFHDNEREEVFIYTRDFINNVVRSLGFIVE